MLEATYLEAFDRMGLVDELLAFSFQNSVMFMSVYLNRVESNSCLMPTFCLPQRCVEDE